MNNKIIVISRHNDDEECSHYYIVKYDNKIIKIEYSVTPFDDVVCYSLLTLNSSDDIICSTSPYKNTLLPLSTNYLQICSNFIELIQFIFKDSEHEPYSIQFIGSDFQPMLLQYLIINNLITSIIRRHDDNFIVISKSGIIKSKMVLLTKNVIWFTEPKQASFSYIQKLGKETSRKEVSVCRSNSIMSSINNVFIKMV